MNDVKISLTVQSRGRVLMKESECDSFDKYKIFLNFKVKDKPTKEILYIKTRRGYPVFQNLNINRDAYEYFKSTEVPPFAKKKEWNQMSAIQRIEAHLDRICHDLKGESFTYIIIPD